MIIVNFMQHHCSNVPGINCLSVCPIANVQLNAQSVVNAPQSMRTEGQLFHWPKLLLRSKNKYQYILEQKAMK